MLNAALVMALKDWTGRYEFMIEQESHGRHLDDIDVSRTAGWFTIMYPAMIRVSTSSTSDLIRMLKEQIKTIPVYNSHHPEPADVRLNYLGDFTRQLHNDLFTYSSLYTGREIHEGNHMTARLELNAMIVHGELHIDILYNVKAHNRETIVSFADLLLQKIKEICTPMMQKDSQQFSPSDFDSVDLTQDELKLLF